MDRLGTRTQVYRNANTDNNEYVLEMLNRNFAGRGLAAVRIGGAAERTAPVTNNYRQQRMPAHLITADEFTAMYRSTHRVPTPVSRPVAQRTQTAVNTARPQMYRTAGVSAVPSRNAHPDTRRESALNVRNTAAQKSVSNVKTAKTPVRRSVKKQNENKKDLAIIRNFRGLPVSALVTVIVCAMSLMLIVGSSVMMNSASGQYSDLQSDISTLAKQQSELQTALEVKNDLRMIEDIAVNKLGMVNKDLVTRQYVKLNDEDMIESFDGEESNVGLSTLLSAIGGGKVK